MSMTDGYANTPDWNEYVVDDTITDTITTTDDASSILDVTPVPPESFLTPPRVEEIPTSEDNTNSIDMSEYIVGVEDVVEDVVEAAELTSTTLTDSTSSTTADITSEELALTLAELDQLLPPNPQEQQVLSPDQVVAVTPPDGSVSTSTIGVCMTLTSERHIIERALASVRCLGDRFLFTYNGDDGTDQVVKDYLAKYNLECKVDFYPWKHYGHNKSKLLKDAHENELKDCTVLLWLDADEVFFDVQTNMYPDHNTKKKLLKAIDENLKKFEHFDLQLWTYYCGSRYPRWNILRNNQLYQWTLPVHEYLEAVEHPDNSPSLFMLDVLNLCARKDGARSIVREAGEYSKAVEYVNYWKAWHAEDPENLKNPRGMFYYAQCIQEAYNDTRDPLYIPQFLDWYQRRIDEPTGNQEERYMSMYRLGVYYIEQHKLAAHEKTHKKAIRYLERASREFPCRFEALHYLQFEWRDNEKMREKLIPLIERRMNMYIYHNQNFDDLFRSSLFANEDMVRIRFPFEAALTMHKINRHDKAIEYNQYALKFMGAGDHMRMTANSNDYFYKKALREQLDAENGLEAVNSTTETNQDDHSALNDSTDAAQILANLDSFLPIEYSSAADTATANEDKLMQPLTLQSIATSRSAKIMNNPTCFNLSRLPDVVIIDNFLADPMAVRRFALAQSFNVTGNYPGSRTIAFQNPTIKSVFEQITCSKINFWPDKPDEYNGAFQLTDGTNYSWIHRDKTDYAGILYLTPDGPVNAGTNFYRHRVTGLEYAGDENQTKQMDEDSRNFGAWDVVDAVAYKFNRLVLFNGRRSHMSGQYFGRGKETGRLFMNFFFNAVRRQ